MALYQGFSILSHSHFALVDDNQLNSRQLRHPPHKLRNPAGKVKVSPE
jgi:hypothetical protein